MPLRRLLTAAVSFVLETRKFNPALIPVRRARAAPVGRLYLVGSQKTSPIEMN